MTCLERVFRVVSEIRRNPWSEPEPGGYYEFWINPMDMYNLFSEREFMNIFQYQINDEDPSKKTLSHINSIETMNKIDFSHRVVVGGCVLRESLACPEGFLTRDFLDKRDGIYVREQYRL